MILRVLRKIAQRHLNHHLLIPLVVGVAIEYLTHRLTDAYREDLWAQTLALLAPVLGVFAAYFVVMYFVIREETRVGLQRIRSATLETALEDATGFLGMGVIELKEWFEPSSQVYLATIMKRKIEHPAFAYNRVLLFSRGAFKDLDNQFLGHYPAKALIDIHRAHGIGLGYLRPGEVEDLTDALKPDEWKAIGVYPRWVKGWNLRFIPRRWRAAWIRRLALAVVERGGARHYLQFEKHERNVDISEIPGAVSGAARQEIYDRLVDEIRRRAFDGDAIDAEHDFLTFYG
jgi:hypothetical protein